MFALAHFSDPHLAQWRAGELASLLNKRMTGLLSWLANRRKIHLKSVLDLLLADLRAMKPDHVALTGDIVNISSEDEFQRAAQWLEGWADPRIVSVIPGNHDAYVDVAWDSGLGRWSAYMSSFNSPSDAPQQIGPTNPFPYVRVQGGVAIVGISSAVPMPPFIAAGRVGHDQLRRLRACLMSLRRAGLFRVVLIHHPPFAMPFFSRRKALLDADSFCATIAESGAELVLHGHTHVAGLGRIGEVPVIGVPSASAGPKSHKDIAAYNLYRIEREGPRWQIAVEERALTPDSTRFERRGQFTLSVGSPAHA